jgi:hypothetical protein
LGPLALKEWINETQSEQTFYRFKAEKSFLPEVIHKRLNARFVEFSIDQSNHTAIYSTHWVIDPCHLRILSGVGVFGYLRLARG